MRAKRRQAEKDDRAERRQEAEDDARDEDVR